MNHKRRRPKHQRAGCLMCKPWKHEGSSNSVSSQRRQERRSVDAEREQLEDLVESSED